MKVFFCGKEIEMNEVKMKLYENEIISKVESDGVVDLDIKVKVCLKFGEIRWG